jgi:hypothetical protein
MPTARKLLGGTVLPPFSISSASVFLTDPTFYKRQKIKTVDDREKFVRLKKFCLFTFYFLINLAWRNKLPW